MSSESQLKKIDIMPCEETGEIISVEVVPEETVGQLMERLGYGGMTLVRDDYYWDLTDNFSGGSQAWLDLLLDNDSEVRPFCLGLAE